MAEELKFNLKNSNELRRNMTVKEFIKHNFRHFNAAVGTEQMLRLYGEIAGRGETPALVPQSHKISAI